MSITMDETNPFINCSDRELIHIYFNSKSGFADESIHLAQEMLIKRGYHFGAGSIRGLSYYDKS
jgi:hypothetical protein